MNRIAAVVVTYNRLELLRQCVAALLAQRDAVCDILLVDNASTDGTAAWAEQFAAQHPAFQYRNTGANIGGAGGFNFGMRWAAEAGYEYVWIMDDDCLPRPDALAKLLEADALLGGPEQYGFLSSTVLWTDGSECKMNRQKLQTGVQLPQALSAQGLQPVAQATFVSLLFPAQVIRAAGLPIKEFFIWGDDVEYTRRLAVRMGLPCYWVGQSQVIHAMAQNSGSSIAADAPGRIDRYRYAYRNEAYLYRQEGVRGVCYYLAKCALNAARIVFTAKGQRLRRLRVLTGSMIKGFSFSPAVETL